MSISTTNSEKKYFKQFDGARGLFQFFIFLFHLQFFYVKSFAILGYFTLHLFYMASAFLITSILLKDLNKYKSFKLFFGQFYTKRILRIFPVYFGYIFLAIVVAFIYKQIVGHDLLGILTEIKQYGWMLFTFTYNFKDLLHIFQHHSTVETLGAASSVFPHLWSVSIEEQFYVLIPFIVYFLSQKNIMRLSIFMIITFAIYRFFIFDVIKSHSINDITASFTFVRCTLFQLDVFFYGVLMALLPKLNINKVRIAFYSIVAVIFIHEIYLVYTIHLKLNISYWSALNRYDMYAITNSFKYLDVLVNILSFTFLYLAMFTEREFPILLNKYLVDWGKYSYGAYVYQYIFILPAHLILCMFLQKYIHLFLAEIISAIICFAAIISFAKFSFYKFELYFLLKKDYFINKLTKKQ